MSVQLSDLFLPQLVASLDPAALREFGKIEQIILTRSMELCGMTEYPAVSGDPSGDRTYGEMICDRCSKDYFSHPMDWRVIGYGDVPFLNVLCDGQRVKL